MEEKKTVAARNNLDDFFYFCRLQLEMEDHDPHIPFLIELTKEFNREQAILLGLLFMAYYQEASAWIAYSQNVYLGLPISVQRRNLYGGRITRHLNEFLAIENLEEWLRVSTWSQLLNKFGSIYGNGRWSSYTSSELMIHLAKLDIEPTSYEILESSGPRQGLEFLGFEPSEDSAETLRKELDIPVSVLESLLCDWAGMNKGSFYPGRNIDRQQSRILRVENLTKEKLSPLWKARRRVFPQSVLGEFNGWKGINSNRLKIYRDDKIILKPEEDRVRL